MTRPLDKPPIRLFCKDEEDGKVGQDFGKDEKGEPLRADRVVNEWFRVHSFPLPSMTEVTTDQFREELDNAEGAALCKVPDATGSFIALEGFYSDAQHRLILVAPATDGERKIIYERLEERNREKADLRLLKDLARNYPNWGLQARKGLL